MKNIFTFPKYSSDETSKITSRVFKILAIVMACFIASLFVSGLVSDRIERSEKAIDNVSGLSKFAFDPLVGIVASGEERKDASYGYFVTDVNIDIQSIISKKLGNQNVPVYTASVTSSGTFKKDVLPLLNLTKGQIAEYQFVLPAGSDIKTVSLTVNGTPFTDYRIISSDYFKSIVISENKVQDNSQFKLAYSATGISRLQFDRGAVSPGHPENYNVKVHTLSSNVRLINSGNSTYDSKSGVAEMTVNQYDMQTGLVFLPGSDDITFVDRIVKYAILFIAIVFALAFFLDLRKGLVFNLIQYFFMGMSLALFYLLVLALGEQIGYLPAYVAASALTAVLDGWYVTEVFNSKKIGTSFGVSLLVLYAIMYYLINVTSVNLLLGTGILYAILIVFMIASKNSNRK